MKSVFSPTPALLFSILSFLLFGSCAQKKYPELLTLEGFTMGTVYSVKVVKQGPSDIYNTLSQNVEKTLQSVNLKMSTYIDSSEISQLNISPANEWLKISPELYFVLAEADRVSKLSSGAFDITVGPLVNLWGFGAEDKNRKIPQQEEIDQRKKKIGYSKLVLQDSLQSVKKEIPDLYCDLSAIAKGYGVDVIADYFDSLGIKNYLVEVGGEVRAKGKNQKDQDWRIGIQSPENLKEIYKIISVSNRAVATSGDYQNYFEENGVRYSHTIGPRTGKPITHKLASVTVVHASCMTADAMATAINVMGPEQGLKLAQSLELAVLLIVKNQNGFISKMTPQFKEIVLN
jgi:FAD:protein FMN transferase